MTDFTHHTPRLLTDEDAAADLAGVARPSLPSVGTEDARAAERDAWLGGSSYEAAMLRELLANIHRDGGHYVARHGLEKALSDAHTVISQLRCASLVSERDELASRVSELEGALCRISDMVYDSWTNGAIAKQIADAALNASKEQP